MASVLILHPCVKVIMHKGKDGLVMEVREIYKISDMIHKAAGWKKENVFLFLNTIFWAVLAFVIGVAAFTLITGTIAGHVDCLLIRVGIYSADAGRYAL